jgi:FkbM family methyltransferase
MIINTNDKYIGRSIEQLGAWATDDIELIKSILDIQLENSSQVTFYDVGANIGTHTVALARYFGDRIRVRSFEAQRQIYYMLCGNVAINGLDNVICEYLAVSDVNDSTISVSLPSYTEENNFGGVELIKPCNSDNQDMIKPNFENVITTTLDHYNESVDFVKMDVEGMEHLVLAGAEQTFKKHRPVCFFEVLKTDVSAVKTFFKKQNYQIYQLRQDDWIAVADESDVELDLPKVLF